MTVRLDEAGGAVAAAAGQEERNAGSRVVTLSPRKYEHPDHGYAATTHKVQGVTVDRAHVQASEHMDRHAAYETLARHWDGVDLHWSEEALGDRPGLARTLGRERLKDTSLDYGLDAGPGPSYEAPMPTDGMSPCCIRKAPSWCRSRGAGWAAEAGADSADAGKRLSGAFEILSKKLLYITR